MSQIDISGALDRNGQVIRLSPQIVGRFYGDLNRLGQRPTHGPEARRPDYYKPERWIGSSTEAANPPEIPSGGLSTCPKLGNITLRDLLKHPEHGPRLLGPDRYRAHGGTFRVLIKILDAQYPIPFHVHADDAFVGAHPHRYPNEVFGKDEAYYFLDAPKGDCPYTHVGLHEGVDLKQVLAALVKGTDYVLELSPAAVQNFGEGLVVRGGLLHRPGSALTLEIQQPSDVYAFCQKDFGGEPLAQSVLHPGFDNIEQALASVVNWDENVRPGLLESIRLRPTPVADCDTPGAVVEWIYPPDISDKFSGMRLTVDTTLTLRAEDAFVAFVWRGKGELDGQPIDGRGGPVGAADEFFVGQAAAKRGIELQNTGDQSLVVFALFAARV